MPLRAFVDRTKYVGGILNIADRENFVTALGIEIGARLQGSEQIVVQRAAGNCLFEDGRVRRHAAQSIFRDQTLQFAAGKQVAADVVQPNRLAEFQKIFERVGGFSGIENSSGLHCVPLFFSRRSSVVGLQQSFKRNDLAED